jgi:thymidylate synthase
MVTHHVNRLDQAKLQLTREPRLALARAQSGGDEARGFGSEDVVIEGHDPRPAIRRRSPYDA